jgi:hypothetical protein
LLRGDQSRLLADQATQYKDAQIAIVDLIDRDLIRSFMNRLKKELPGISISTIDLTRDEVQAEVGSSSQDQVEKIAKASIIVGPWMMAVSGWGNNLVPHEIAQAVVKSSARKILIPSRADGWEWAGVERWKEDSLVRQTVRAVGQVLEGEDIKLAKPLGAGAIIGIIIAAIVILSLLSIPLIYFFLF